MMNSSDIQYISGLLKDPSMLADADSAKLAALKARYPYFVPVRYLEAAVSQKQEQFSAGMLTEVYPYNGNHILFCDFLRSVTEPKPAKRVAEVAEAEVEEQMVSEITIVEAEPEVETLQMHIDEVIEEAVEIMEEDHTMNEPLIQPVYTEDYFLHQGIKISDDLPQEEVNGVKAEEEDPRSLMVMMSFAEWMLHFKRTSEKEKEETEGKKALKTMWQMEKLAAAMEEENEEIPESVFEMAVNSIAKEEGLASEALANIYIKQGKYDKAIDMYRKLSLRNPQKNAYFAGKIEEILKEKQS